MLSKVSQCERTRGLVEGGDRGRNDKGRTVGEWQISAAQATNEGPCSLALFCFILPDLLLLMQPL